MRIVLAPATLTLSAVCGLLTLVLAYQIVAPLSGYSLPELSAFKMPAVKLEYSHATLPPAQTFDVINSRPLFTATRTPAPKTDAPAAQAAAPPPLPNASLVGIIIDSSRRIALIRSPASPLAQSYSSGDSLEAWKIAAIEVDHIVLRAGSFEQQLNLNTNRAPLTNPVPPIGNMQQDIPQTAMSP